MFGFTSQASLGPYAWEKVHEATPLCTSSSAGDASSRHDDPENRRGHIPTPQKRTYHLDAVLPSLDDELLKLDRTNDCFVQIENEHHITCKLPRAGLTAGRILGHSEGVFETLMSKHSPMSFKFGLTHCPCFRWNHKPYGYKHGKERFESMVLLYTSHTVTGPAFLEAALISKFRSAPPW